MLDSLQNEVLNYRTFLFYSWIYWMYGQSVFLDKLMFAGIYSFWGIDSVANAKSYTHSASFILMEKSQATYFLFFEVPYQNWKRNMNIYLLLLFSNVFRWYCPFCFIIVCLHVCIYHRNIQISKLPELLIYFVLHSPGLPLRVMLLVQIAYRMVLK